MAVETQHRSAGPPSEAELRAKWSQPREILDAERSAAHPARPAHGHDEYEKLAKVKICQACQAHGIVKVQYGYRVMDQVCEQCDGEGCIIPERKVVQHLSTAEKIAAVHKLIENATDITELERLESALRSGELDDVLVASS